MTSEPGRGFQGTVSRHAAVLAILVCVAVFASHASDHGTEDGFARLETVIAGQGSSPAAPLMVHAEELMGLDLRERRILGRWVRRGGRVIAGGSDAEMFLDSMFAVPGAARPGGPSFGLGEVVRTGAAPVSYRSKSLAGLEALTRTALALARTGLPDAEKFRLGTAARLAGYGLLLAIGFRLGRRSTAGWSRAGILSLVVATGCWPIWGCWTSHRLERWHQVDLIVDVDDGSAIVWSAVAIRPGARRSLELEAGPDSWNHHISTGMQADGPTRYSGESNRGSRIEGTWLAEGRTGKLVQVEVGRGDDGVTVLVRNTADQHLEFARLILPGGEQFPLEDIAPRSAELLVLNRGATNMEVSGSIPGTRDRLIRSAREFVIDPLLRRNRPVLVAWTREPLLPVRMPGGETASDGVALVVSAGRVAP